ncbi:MAG: globin [Acidimicrobiia bacterium]|nr:globin [Acidimicrobiia bacterium]
MSAGGAPGEAVTLYQLVGGTAWFESLVDRFYAGVAEDEVLRPLYPEQDLTGARRRLTGFLVQYWGGPDDYSQARGHPRLRMRHAPFAVGARERDRWVRHMAAAVRAAQLQPDAEAALLDYFDRAATAMVNQPAEGTGP